MTTDASENSREQSETSGLREAYGILRGILRNRISNDPLGPDTVPPQLLGIPLDLAVERLVLHARKCHNPSCLHIPPPLLRYQRMRPKMIRTARDEIYRVLWVYPDHEFVTLVRSDVLAHNSKLAEEISQDRLLSSDKLEEFLHEHDPEGPRILAAVLWASKFEQPEAELFFRMLVALEQNGASGDTGRPTAGANGQQLKSLKLELRAIKEELNRTKQGAKKAEERLHNRKRALERAKRELKGPQQRYQAIIEERDALQKQLQDTKAALTTVERDGEKARKGNADLRRDLHQRQNDLRRLGLERSDLARKLAAEARRVEHLRLELESLPRGADAVRGFLRDEEERIQTNRRIGSGGNKIRADQEWAAYRKLEAAFLDAYPQYRQPRPVKIRPKTPLRFVALGGSDEVGRSCYLLELGEHRILVDCGIKPSESQDLSPSLERLEQVHALLLTHAHTDHIGWVPALIRRLGDVDIYCSDGTAALMPVMLEDCRWHYVRKMQELREHARYSQNPAIINDEYDDRDVERVTDLVSTFEFGQQEGLPFGDVSIRLFRAGHILGAASILIEDASGRRIFFSGDFASFPQLTVPAAGWPDDLGEIDLLVLESTYGGRMHPPFTQSRQELIGCIRETIEVRKGSVLLASFALGRAQELLKLIVTAQQTGELPLAIPIYVDGMIRRINPIYSKLADFDLPAGVFNEVSGETERQELAVSAQRNPSIIVTTSGMLYGGPVIEYARHLLPDSRHQLVLTGFQDEGAPGKALLGMLGFGRSHVLRVRDENGDWIEVEAGRPAKHIKLSAHADEPGLIEYAKQLRPKNIVLVHGEARAQKELRCRLLEALPSARITPGPWELAVP